MTDKILCPFCGAEMRVEGQYNTYGSSWLAYARCMDCGAAGPMERNNNDSEEAIKSARAAALRRYTPMLTMEPLTLGGALGRDVVLEVVWGNKLRNIRVPYHLSDRIELLVPDSPLEGVYSEWINKCDYGRTWRCWERKPTDKERRAAEWD